MHETEFTEIERLLFFTHAHKANKLRLSTIIQGDEKMQLADVSFNDVISPAGTQFVIPIWQRLYSWESKELNDLWQDLMGLYEKTRKGEAAEHFLGSIVVKTVEEKVGEITKRVLIDGQQRLTTLLVLCALLKDRAKAENNENLANIIEDYILFNKHVKKIEDRPKLRPTKADYTLFNQIIYGDPNIQLDYSSQLYFAYSFFKDKLESNRDRYDTEELLNTIRKLRLVTIRLDEKDNPNRIFETLNYRGKELEQADLVRNFFMMAIKDEPTASQVYENIWYPMQQRLGSHTWEQIKNLEKFLRHYVVMNEHVFVKEDKIYAGIRERLKNPSSNQAISELKVIGKYSQYYERLLYPEKEENLKISKGIERLNRLKIGVHYPFLLKVYRAFDSKDPKITEEDFCNILETIESYIVRRFFHGKPTHSLNRLFASLCGLSDDTLADSLRKELASKQSWKAQYWPVDNEFQDDFRILPIYKISHERCRFVLETLEESFEHPEEIRLENLEIEHVMPETIDEHWQKYLGDDWERVKDTFLHTISNLTLIAPVKNKAIQNKLFPDKKKEWYVESNVELTKEIVRKWDEWTEAEIQERANILAKRAVEIWTRPM